MSYYDNTTDFGQHLSSGQRDIWAYIDAYLDDVGLGELSTWAQTLLVEHGAELTEDQFRQSIRETDQYKTRFKAIELARKEGRPIPTEAEVLQTEREYTRIFQEADMPPTFYDEPEDFATMISRGISPNEVQRRIIDGYTAVRNDPGWQAQLQNLYQVGGTESDLVAFFLDPDRGTTAIERRQAAAGLSNRAQKSGFNALNIAQAERLASQGVTDAQARQGFGQLAQQQGLFNPLASEQGSISRDTGLAATFEENADAQEELERRRQERQSRFSGGGGFSTSNTGLTGVGSSR